MITWLHDTNNELITDDVNDLKTKLTALESE